MIIFGVDPGTIGTGYGIVKYINNTVINVASGIIKPSASYTMALKLEKIYDDLCKFIKMYKPDEFSIETAFYGKNVQSAMKIGYVRGVALLAAAHSKLPAHEYSPREIKKSVVGNGAASKKQVQFMIKKLLTLENNNMKYDESDAFAVAICHAFKKSSLSHKSGSWEAFIKANPEKVISN